jgi:hypothetical protein
MFSSWGRHMFTSLCSTPFLLINMDSLHNFVCVTVICFDMVNDELPFVCGLSAPLYMLQPCGMCAPLYMLQPCGFCAPLYMLQPCGLCAPLYMLQPAHESRRDVSHLVVPEMCDLYEFQGKLFWGNLKYAIKWPARIWFVIYSYLCIHTLLSAKSFSAKVKRPINKSRINISSTRCVLCLQLLKTTMNAFWEMTPCALVNRH